MSLPKNAKSDADEKNVWAKCVEAFRSINLKELQNIDEKEIAIYNTEDGVLFNKEVIEKNAEVIEIPKNIKRDYSFASYKEQLADLQLKKELAEKRKREGILSDKQKKAVDAELKQEQEIRSKLKRLYESFESKMKLVFLASKKNPEGAYENLKLLYDVIIPMIRSPLFAKPAVKAFLSFRDSIFQTRDDNLEKIVAHTSLRILGSKFLLDHWCDISLDEQLQQLFLLLSTTCIIVSYDDEFEQDDSETNEEADSAYLMSTSKLAFLIPLLEELLVRNPKSFDMELRIRAVLFLKSAIAPNFIRCEEVCSPPMIYLATMLINALVSRTSMEYTNELFESIESLFKMIDSVTDMQKNEQLDCLLRSLPSHIFDSNDSIVRRNILKLLSALPHFIMRRYKMDTEIGSHYHHYVYLSTHDPDVNCAKLARCLLDDLGFKLTIKLYQTFLPNIYSTHELLRLETADSLRDFIVEFPSIYSEVIKLLEDSYIKLSALKPAEFDLIGRKISEEVDPWQQRSGVAFAFYRLSELIPQHLTVEFIKKIVPRGLNDRTEKCRTLMRDAARLCINKHGSAIIDELLPFLENELNCLPKSAENDNICQGLVVLIGTLAQYIKDDDSKVRKILARLIQTLSTPSQQVQESVASCLPALVPSQRESSKELIQNLMILLTNAECYGERRGAAYGITAIIKGLGIASIKELDISKKLKVLLAQKEKPICREGALLCIELFSSTLGKLFEPYLVHLLFDILNSFGDSSDIVRRAADDAAKAMMRSLSAHGIKLILPSLLKAIDEDSWRTKCAAVELLGAMSNCAPRQLSSSLPSIVPKLCDVLADTSTKVQKAGEKSLKQIAQVIQNPEIMAISQHLIQALVDPAGKTTMCLQIIVNNKFVHYVDSPSLALMMPIIYRSFEERNTEARRMAAQIIANIYSLVDHKDMEPYLESLMPGLRKALLDPVPEVRTVASRAIGSIVKYSAPATSEKIQAEIMPWLKENLVSKNSTVDRSGAAQGLSEVVAALNDDYLTNNINGIVKITESPSIDPYIRDGYILLLTYMPIALGEKFVPYIEVIIPSILKALADENEYVRESALRAGQRLISTYCGHARKLLLPKLQSALINENWRIRFAAVKLIGEFLFNISGVSSKMTSVTSANTNEDETIGSETISKAIVRQIGQRSRDEILAGIYLARYDVSLICRQAAGHVWKVVVSNTPKTLKDLLNPLFELLLVCMSSSGNDRQQMAARCLSELVKKMGEKTLASVLPILEARLIQSNIEGRRGVIVALDEIIRNVGREVIEGNSASLIKSIRTCLSEPDRSIRNAAAITYASFHNSIGFVAVEEIITPMLEEFSQTQNQHILDGLCAVMSGPSGRGLFNGLLSKLGKPPVNSLALCRLVAATGDSLSRNLSRVLDALLCREINTSVDEHVQNCLPVFLSLESDEDIKLLLSSLLSASSSQSGTRIMASIILKEYMSSVESGVPEESFDSLIPGLLCLYYSQDPEVVENAIETLSSLVDPMDQEQKLSLVLLVKRASKILWTDSKATRNSNERLIPGLCQSKGWAPLNAILREGILHGNVEVKESSGMALSQLIQMSDESGLKAHAINMAGPLIRVLGEKHPSPVKIAILTALNKLLEKLSTTLRPFLPQMQSVFLKTLYADEPSENLRQLAAQSISRILEFHPKPDIIFKELSKISDEKGMKDNPLIDDLLNEALGKMS